MLKREITYENFDGETVTETFYFNMSKPELVELDVNYERGFNTFIERIFEAKDNRTIVEQFKKIILMSYGVRSEDGKRFIKTAQLREEFEQTAAYSHLFMELAEDENVATEFIEGILPRDLVESHKQNPDKPTGIPTLPRKTEAPPMPGGPTHNVFDPPKEG